METLPTNGQEFGMFSARLLEIADELRDLGKSIAAGMEPAEARRRLRDYGDRVENTTSGLVTLRGREIEGHDDWE